MSKRVRVKKPAVTPKDSGYAIKGMDRGVWEAFTRRAHGEGRTIRWVLDRFIESYAKREPLNLESGS